MHTYSPSFIAPEEGISVRKIRAIFFDFGGTLFDYSTTAPGERESLIALARVAGITADTTQVQQSYRDALKRTFYRYLPRPFYLHRDMFDEALTETARYFEVSFTPRQLSEYRKMQEQLRNQNFKLREGVEKTLATLRRRGLHLGIVSNVDNEQFSQILTLSGLQNSFDSFLTSEDAGSCKPDQLIFLKALEQAHCRPHEAAFVGDSIQQDIAGANRCGLHSVLLWSRPNKLPKTSDVSPGDIIHNIPDILNVPLFE